MIPPTDCYIELSVPIQEMLIIIEVHTVRISGRRTPHNLARTFSDCDTSVITLQDRFGLGLVGGA